MRRALTALIAAAGLVSASPTVFSIHDDIDAFPQYNIAFSPAPISSSDAAALLASPKHAQEADASSIPLEYDRLILHSTPHLCSIPRPPQQVRNLTTEALNRASLALELSRANIRGWELLSPLDNTCLYFMSGWWSYRFCYNDSITQFHASAPPPGRSHIPPTRDPMTPKYVLGRAKPPLKISGHDSESERKVNNEGSEEGSDGGSDLQLRDPRKESSYYDEERHRTLQTKGDTRYLVQKMDSGTICDLTLRPREIEVQYHCAASDGDRIAWIKEVTTCSYLMVVHTPRLCSDVAFQPPVPTESHEVVCRPIIGEADVDLYSADPVGQETVHDGRLAAIYSKAADAAKSLTKATKEKVKGEPLILGGTVVGGGKYFPAANPPLLKPPSNWQSNSHAAGNERADSKGSAGSPKSPGTAGAPGSLDSEALAAAVNARLESDKEVVIDILAHGKGQNDDYQMMSDKELRKVGIKPTVVMGLAEQLRLAAGERGWTLALVEGEGIEGREIRGVVDGSEGGVKGEEKKDTREVDGKEWTWELVEDLLFEGGQDGKAKKWTEEKEARDKISHTVKGKEKDGARKQPQKATRDGDREEESEKGSEETYYKEEL